MTGKPYGRLISLALLALLASSEAVVAQRQRGGTVARERLFAALSLALGATAGEIGAGDGELSVQAARIVGPTGRLYTSELGEERVRKLESAVSAAGLSQVVVVTGQAASTNFPDECCDAIFMRDVYHHFGDPAAMNASIFRSLRPGGRLAIADFTPPSDRGEAARPDGRSQDGTHGVTPETLTRELMDAGFEAVSSEKGDGRWFLVVATKPAGRLVARRIG
jgi:ubiquinone/menaquinone biosynthesis C-methylase UbiE